MAAQTNFEIWSGDNKALSIAVKNDAGVAVPLTDASDLSFVVKESQESAVVLFDKTLGSGIEVTDSPGGVFEVAIDPTDTEDLDGVYYWESVVTDVQDGIYTAAFGYMAVHGKSQKRGSYCSLAEALALMADVTVSERTVPNLATAQIIVDTIARDIDGVLMGRGVELPVTDPQLLAFLKTMNQYGSCAAIIKSKKPVNTGMAGDGGAFSYYENKYQAGLAQLANPSFTVVTVLQNTKTMFSHGFETTLTCDEPFWTRRTRF